MTKARIAVVDDHPAVVLGATTIINTQPDMHVVATGATVAELLASGLAFDLVLLDLSLADGSTPTSNVRALVRTGAAVLAYAAGDLPGLVREAGRAGARGMVGKSELPDEVVRAIRAVLRGEVPADADWTAALEADGAVLTARLSEREIQVLGLYASGETAERVGALLYISRETVLDHIRRIRAKYAAVDRPAPTKVDLYRRAVEDGLVPAAGWAGTAPVPEAVPPAPA